MNKLLPKKTKKRVTWTNEKTEYFKEILPDRHYDEVAKMMSFRFNEEYQVNMLKSKAQRLGIKSGLPGCHPRPVGSTRININGYKEIKIAEPNVWEKEHIYLWKKKYGEIPEGYVLTFADSDRQNTSLDNIILLTKREHFLLNTRGLSFDNKESTLVGLSIVRLGIKIKELKGGGYYEK